MLLQGDRKLKNSKKYVITFLFAMMVLCFAPVVHANAGWESTNSGMKYKISSSKGYATNCFKTINGKKYYFDKNGIMQTGFVTVDGNLYYFGTNGVMKTGKFKVNGKCYYAKDNGVCYVDRWLNGTYYFQSDGSMATSKWIINKWVNKNGKYKGKYKTGWIDWEGNTYYYINESTYATGWIKVGSSYYYLDSKGVLQKNTWVDNKKYYVNSSGARITNQMKTINGKTYIFDKNGLKLTSQWVQFNGNYYIVGKTGAVRKNKWIGKRYVDSNGVRVTGWATIDGDRYYFKSNGKRVSGLAKIGGKYYYFESSGKLVKSAWANEKYYAGSDGVLYTGLHEIEGEIYYFNKNTYKKVTKKMKKVNGYTYFFKATSGQAARDERVYYGTSFYYFDSNGRMVKNKWVDQYYYGSSGAQEKYRSNNGWWKSDNGTTYYYKNGEPLTGLQTIDGDQYYFNSKGEMQTGIVKIGSNKYYFASSGKMQKSTTITVGSTEYKIDSSGVVTKVKDVTASGSSSSKGTEIANYALQYVGNPYVYGGTSLTNGADCSGFVQTVFKHFGYTLLRTADEQMKGPSSSQISSGYTAGTSIKVSTSTLQPGDLLFYGTSSYASHVAIYIGNGQIVHASNSQPYPAGGIKISNYDYNTPVKAMRYWS